MSRLHFTLFRQSEIRDQRSENGIIDHVIRICLDDELNIIRSRLSRLDFSPSRPQKKYEACNICQNLVMMLFTLMIAATAGTLAHLCYFVRGEHHLYGVKYIQVLVFTFSAAVFLLYQRGEVLSKAVALVAENTLSFLAGLYTSLMIYRLLLHPLNKFPGPMEARISSFWLSGQLKDGDAFRKVYELHEKFGDFVRVGSSDLSITHPKAVSAVYGLGSKCTKAAWYDLTRPMVSLQTLRVKKLHDQRRRIWSPAFSDKALRGYEEKIQKYRTKLLAQIEASDGQPINISKWFNLYSFDVMGDLAFGASFHMLETNQEHWAIKLLNEGLEPLAWMFPVWFFRVMTAVPGLARDWWKFIDYCAQRLDQRMSVSGRDRREYQIS